jgi:hypothetical protein
MRTFGLFLLGWFCCWYAEFVIDVEDGVGEGVKCEEGGLCPAMEIDGGVVGQEGSTEIDVPRHFLLLLLLYTVFQNWKHFILA